MDLVTRDAVEHGGSGVLTTRAGHTVVERHEAATKWATGTPRQFRVGCTIGPHHYHGLGPYRQPPPTAVDEWAAIDLRHTLSARTGVRHTMSACGYATDWGDDYSLTVRRGGISVTMSLAALCWVNDRGQQQVIATPKFGQPSVVDEDGLWVIGALGPGIDYGLRLWPDMLRPCIRVADPAALLQGLARPMIDPHGLRLAKVLNVGHSGGQPDDLVAQSRYRRIPGGVLLRGVPDEARRNPGRFAMRESAGAPLWFHEGRAWTEGEEAQNFDLRADWRRYGESLTLALSLDAVVLSGMAGPLLLDTTMAEQQVGASNCDTWVCWSDGAGVWAIYTSIGLIEIGYYFANEKKGGGGNRFAPPLDKGVTVGSASITVRAYSSDTSTVVRSYVRCEASDNAAVFSTVGDYNGRSRVANPVAWDSIASWTEGTWYTSPDIAAHVGAVVARSGWATGQGLVVFHDDHDDRSDHNDQTHPHRRSSTYDKGATYGAKLNATYTAGGGGISAAILGALVLDGEI